ncbi:hypothetical protein KF947_10780 [Halomonas sp. FeN2]|uniref:hypothetical protein n=1 Tax=Halomonas sp. FeN2 TaxID=2832500 RepID=UPI000C5543EC|nr:MULTISPECIES: hypothetical protein [unclassified Halomonas]MBF59137.1 hypothetical protein [Halomonas sp.]UBR51922.1 hypothetical protein KF947_10780 [Halomonas sp. FeN2]
MKKWVAYFWIIALTLISAPAMAQETEYQFGVRWSVNGLASSVDIQDVMLDFKGVPSEQNTMLPITQYVRNGRNALQFYAWPVPSAEPFEEQHELRLSVEYWEPDENPNIDAKTAFEVVMMPGVKDAKPEIVSIDQAAPVQPRESDISWDQDYFKLTVPFNNRQPMPTWCWEEGDVLNDNDATRASLTREYRRLHTLFAAGDNDALLAAASTRTTELALASGTPEDYVRDRFSYNLYFDNPDLYQLDDFPEEPMTLNLGADNRVAWLTTKGVSEPIRFNNVSQEGRASYVSLYFIRRDGQWEICR